MRTASLAAAVALALCLTTGTAAAQSARRNEPAAKALVTQGDELMKAGKLSQACAKFADSNNLDPNPKTLIKLGHCFRESGQTASAWTAFNEASKLARAKKQKEADKLAQAEIAAIQPKLTQLVIFVPAAMQESKFEVRLDGVALPRKDWNVPISVDPGAHRVEASGPGKVPFQKQFLVQGAGKVLKVDIPLPEDTAPPAVAANPAAAKPPPAESLAPPQASAPAAPVESAPAEAPSKRSSGTGRRIFGLAMAGVGLAGTGVGGYFGLKMRSADNDARTICEDPAAACTIDDVVEHQDLKARAAEARTVFYVGVGAGGALLVAGTILFLTAPKSEESAAASVTPGAAVGPGFAGVNLQGSF